MLLNDDDMDVPFQSMCGEPKKGGKPVEASPGYS